jgi:predicted enzyme related to lactoylglutathione lyase
VTERDGYGPGVPCWIDTWQPDADAAVAFYTQLFGWEVEDTMPPDVPGKHFMCRLRGRDVAAIASRPQAAPAVTAWGTYVWVESADKAAAQAVDAGGAVLMQPFESLDGGRITVLSDPAGAPIGAWEPGTHRGAQLVNEPGAWSMSELTTSDPEGAEAFYGAVFGWETEPFGDELIMWRRPGYVGGEPEQPVPRDVVAAMTPGEGQAGWSVDFWTGDADAAAETATRLGGAVVAGPFDTPVGRTAVLADPQGAVFSVSKVGPAS